MVGGEGGVVELMEKTINPELNILAVTVGLKHTFDCCKEMSNLPLV